MVITFFLCNNDLIDNLYCYVFLLSVALIDKQTDSPASGNPAAPKIPRVLRQPAEVEAVAGMDAGALNDNGDLPVYKRGGGHYG
ncbi:hypothetical protein ACOZ0S_003478 [Cronobacter dublinensis]